MKPAASHDSDESAPKLDAPSTSAAEIRSAPSNLMPDANEPKPAEPAPMRLTFPKAARMPAGGPYAQVFRHRNAVSDATITLNVGPNGLPWHRLGLGVAKKMFRKAVARNRVKRLIREAFRLERPNFGGGLDLVVRPKVREMTLEDLRRSLRTLVPKAERKFGPDSKMRSSHPKVQTQPGPEPPPENASS